MKKVFKKVWKYLDGKKTKLGTAGGFLTGVLWIVKGFFPEAIPDEVITGMTIISGTTVGVGLTHKGVKHSEEIKTEWKNIVDSVSNNQSKK